MREYKAAIFIGRFQPFHKAHLEVLRQGLKVADIVIMVVGSAKTAPNIKNPWTFEQRGEMVENCLTFAEKERVFMVGVRDYFNNDNLWIRDIQNKVAEFVDPADTVAILGNYKDSSSYYLKYFPQWEYVAAQSTLPLNATDIRKSIFEDGTIGDGVPSEVHTWLSDYMYGDGTLWSGTPEEPGYTPEMCERQTEWAFIKKYKEQWASSPYPPTFVTADAVVVCSGHILVVKRKFNPGMGLLALPGGFVRQSERLKDAALRELKEETGIRVDKIILDNSIVDSHTFDHPGRSLRGRTITTTFYIKLKDGELPEVKGSDDAEKSFWLPLMDCAAREQEFFEDHAHIINFFINRG